MRGDGIVAANQAIRSLTSDLRTDPIALETAHLSVIAFAEQARQISPLIELFEFQQPTLAGPHGQPDIALALRELAACIERDVAKSTREQKGDYRPIVFLITTGLPSPGWQAAAAPIKSRRICNLIGLQADGGREQSVLREIAEPVFDLHSLQPDSLRQFFRWVSSSIKTISHEVDPPRVLSIAPPSTTVSVGPSGPQRNWRDRILLLMDKGADVNVRNKEGNTPLHLAVRANNRQVVELLLSKSVALDLPNHRGDTALLLAVKLGHHEIVSLLIAAGADVNVQDQLGFSALHYAVEQGSEEGKAPASPTSNDEPPPPPPHIHFVP